MRTPAGHPEGYLEGFANIYVAVAEAIAAARLGVPAPERTYPSIQDGVAGMGFIEAALRSHQDGGIWTAVDGQ